jgi:hypothetical protein
MDIKNCEKVNYKTTNNWSNSIRGKLVITNNDTVKKSVWNKLPMSDKFEYSKKFYNNN